MGRSLVALDPNSDRLRLRAMLTPMDRLGVTLSAVYQRHANATDVAVADNWWVGTTDGGINDNGYDKVNGHRFDKVSFLSQDVIEQILLLGFDASWRMPLGRATLYVEGGYTLEVAKNKADTDPVAQASVFTDSPVINGAVPIEGNDVVLHHLSLGLRYAY